MLLHFLHHQVKAVVALHVFEIVIIELHMVMAHWADVYFAVRSVNLGYVEFFILSGLLFDVLSSLGVVEVRVVVHQVISGETDFLSGFVLTAIAQLYVVFSLVCTRVGVSRFLTQQILNVHWVIHVGLGLEVESELLSIGLLHLLEDIYVLVAGQILRATQKRRHHSIEVPLPQKVKLAEVLFADLLYWVAEKSGVCIWIEHCVRWAGGLVLRSELEFFFVHSESMLCLI